MAQKGLGCCKFERSFKRLPGFLAMAIRVRSCFVFHEIKPNILLEVLKGFSTFGRNETC